MTPATFHAPRDPAHRLRSGTAARLAGLPVATLRVWERRYGIAAAASKSESGQRLYGLNDVARLRLLRELTQQGHAIGSIAALDLRALQVLADGLDTLAHPAAARPLEAVAVGRSAAQALQSIPGCLLRAVYDDLDDAAAAQPSAGPTPGLLLVRLASLQPADVQQLVRLGAALGSPPLLVSYGFGTEASADALRRAGATVQREPLAHRELAAWVRSAPRGPAAEARSEPAAPAVPADLAMTGEVAPRQYSDEALARLAAGPSPVACECLRHIAEIVAQLAGFERYSQDCVTSGPVDAALHRQLCRTAGVARTMFEGALQRVVSEAQPEGGRGPRRP